MLEGALKKAQAIIKQANKRDGRKVNEFMPEDIFLISYPKSGNTWVRFILAHLQYQQEDVNFTTIHRFSCEAGRMDENAKKLKSPRIIKSHELFNPLYQKVVYVVRDGRDAYVSYYHYLKNKLPAEMTFKDFLREGSMPYGRWCAHIASWLDNKASQKMLVISYEELHLKPLETVRKIADFAGIESNAHSIGAAIEQSTFDNMKKTELKYGRGKLKTGPEIFMRKGQIGDWKSYFGEEEKKIFKELEDEGLIHLKYEKDANW